MLSLLQQELLELGDKIGRVSTGLREEDILRSLRKGKDSIFSSLARRYSTTTTEVESKCSICQVGLSPSENFILYPAVADFRCYAYTQEEYELSGETGRLECGHRYHMYCIKQWLLLKNACPVCKAPVLKT